MKKYLAVGLGNFGFSLAKTLQENGCEVLGIDTSKELVEEAKEHISHVVIGDASNKEVLRSVIDRDFDGAIVSIGQEMAPSILIALYLKELGIDRIIVRAVSEDHGKILNLIGISEVIYPETEIAVKLANRLSMKNFVDYLPLGEDYRITEVIPPESFIEKSLRELDITTKFNCQIVALKYPDPKDTGNTAMRLKIPPRADDVIIKNSIMILIGKDSDIENILNLK